MYKTEIILRQTLTTMSGIKVNENNNAFNLTGTGRHLMMRSYRTQQDQISFIEHAFKIREDKRIK